MSSFKGRVTHIGEKESFGENFSKISVRVEEETDREFHQSICVDFSNKMLEKVKEIGVGDAIDMSLNYKTNESKTQPWKFFTNISCWKVEILEKAGAVDDDSSPF